ncbi:MAG TPA: polymer-forming cytoskeletal protein [Bryobacteraceae bacterium]|nr:polymer-forming cytoskeletal protein [Bryobacteraceae bacterium]
MPPNGNVAVIGKGMIVKGNIYSTQDMYLDGEVDGELDVENCTLIIGPNGKISANAKAREVDIQGTMTGNVESTRISIRTSGRLVGDIRTAGIVIENGAYFKGRVDIIVDQPKDDKAAKTKQAANAK